MKSQGLFGEVDVRDYRGTRQLRINGQVQGAAYLDPPCADGTIPGPVSSSPYVTGWLLAGALNPKGKGLMIGLGSGAGATAVLANFPGITLDTLEIDPVIIELCLSNFPAVQAAVTAKRLRIICIDALKIVPLLAGDPQRYPYDFIMHDAYDGKALITGNQVEFLKSFAAVSKNVWINIIGVPTRDPMQTFLVDLAKAGIPMQSLFCADYTMMSPFDVHADGRRNWIVSTQKTDAASLDAFEPYSDLQGLSDTGDYNVGTMKAFWELSLRSEISDPADIAALTAPGSL